MEKENIHFCGGQKLQRRKRKKIFGEGKYFFAEETKTEKEKDENLSGKENVTMGGQTDRQTDIVKIVLEF